MCIRDSNNLQSRGRFFIAPQEEVYAGQVIGEHTKDNDLTVNVCKSKKLTNMRAAGSDDKVALAPPVVFSLEAVSYTHLDVYKRQVQAEEIQIWTDIDGLHNNDPRVVNMTSPVRRLSFGEAAELAPVSYTHLHWTIHRVERRISASKTIRRKQEEWLVTNY